MAKVSVQAIFFTDTQIQIQYEVAGMAYEDGLISHSALSVPLALPFTPIAEEITDLVVEMLEYGLEELTRRKGLEPVPEPQPVNREDESDNVVVDVPIEDGQL